MKPTTLSLCRVTIVTSFSLNAVILGATIRVDPDSTTNGPGTSTWSNAYNNLQDALDASSSGDTLWVADGVYKPTVRTDSGDARSVTFLMKSGVVLVGGFQGISRSGGGETQQNQRNPDVYQSILSGDIDNDSVLDADNAYHVVTANLSTITDTSRLNGFTIRHGYGADTGDHRFGAGLRISEGGTPAIIRCKFLDNYAYSGGAIRIDELAEVPSTGPQFLACTFTQNESTNHGGVMYMAGNTRATWVNCLAYENVSSLSAVLRTEDEDSVITLVNCTVVNNENTNQSDGVLSITSTGAVSSCILWGNENIDGQTETAQINAPNVTVESCVIQNLDDLAGNGNIDVDPDFVNAGADDFRLDYTSLVLNNGDDADIPADTFDIDDDSNTTEASPARDMNPRQVNPDGDCIDIGGYENQVEGTCEGDITGAQDGGPDGTVGNADLSMVLARWGTPGGVADLHPSSCGDSDVDIDDYLVVNDNWGTCGGSFAGGGPPSVEESIAILLDILAERPDLEGPIEEVVAYLLQ